jgi:hypothetical protein
MSWSTRIRRKAVHEKPASVHNPGTGDSIVDGARQFFTTQTVGASASVRWIGGLLPRCLSCWLPWQRLHRDQKGCASSHNRLRDNIRQPSVPSKAASAVKGKMWLQATARAT